MPQALEVLLHFYQISQANVTKAKSSDMADLSDLDYAMINNKGFWVFKN